MPPNEKQVNNPLSHDELRSALGFATMLQEQHMMSQGMSQMPQKTPLQESQNGQGQNMMGQVDMGNEEEIKIEKELKNETKLGDNEIDKSLEKMEGRILTEIEGIKTTLTSRDQEIEELKKEVEEILNSNETD